MAAGFNIRQNLLPVSLPIEVAKLAGSLVQFDVKTSLHFFFENFKYGRFGVLMNRL